MNTLLKGFRLTMRLFEQVESGGRSVCDVLKTWNWSEYEALNSYVAGCVKWEPKYVRKLAKLMGTTPERIKGQIRTSAAWVARRETLYTPVETATSGNEDFALYIDDDLKYEYMMPFGGRDFTLVMDDAY